MSTIKVDTIATRTGSGNITASNTIAGTSATLSGTLGVTGDATFDTSTLKVDATNNRVGVGTASPTSDLHVSGGAGAHVAIQSSAGSHWRLGDAVGSSNGIFVVRDHTNSANRIQILADGKTQIAQGVTFGSDTAAANTLDDYEEGTWTPTVTRWTSDMSFSGSPHAVSGKYRKVGNLLHLNFYIQWATSSVTGGGSGGWRITGLPFSNYTSGDGNFLSVGYFYDGIDNKGESTTGDSARLQVNYSSGIMDMYSKNSTSYGTSGSWIIFSASGTLTLA